jgi:hypothetical protein
MKGDNMKKNLSRYIPLLVAFFLTACSLPSSQGQAGLPSGPQAWFDEPLPDTVVRPANPCKIVAHGASQNGIASFEFSTNGSVTDSMPNSDSQETLVTLNLDCQGLQPGENLLAFRVQDKSGAWSDYANTTVILGDANTNVGLPTRIPPTATPLSRATPTPVSTPLPPDTVSIERVSTYQVYIGDSNCGPNQVTITALVSTANPIDAVVLFYRVSTGNASSNVQATSMKSIGNGLYQATINPSSALGGAGPFDQATLPYQVIVQQSDGNNSLRSPARTDIMVKKCGGGGSDALSCSSFTDQRSCAANGCSWVSDPDSFPVNFCTNP